MIHEQYLRIARLDFDDDYAWHVEFKASNGSTVGCQDVYIAPDQLRDFGSQLREFPLGRRPPLLEVERLAPKAPYYIQMRALLADALGHSVLWFVAS